jgi:DNA-binding GntR family transcriptional regulator
MSPLYIRGNLHFIKCKEALTGAAASGQFFRPSLALSFDHFLEERTVDIPGDYYEIDHRDLPDRVYQVLRRDILSGKFAPGQKLPLEEFARYFRVSITPVRDAFRLLASDGLVELLPRRGAFVTQSSAKGVEEVYQIREIMECASVDYVLLRGCVALEELQRLIDSIAATNVGETHSDYLAYISLDSKFHQFLVDCIGNRRMSDMFANLRSHTLVLHALYSAPNQRATGTFNEHESILAALRAGDADAARAAVREHLRNARTEVQQKLANHSASADPAVSRVEPVWRGDSTSPVE